MSQDNYLNVYLYGNQILERGYFRNGERFMRKVKFEPTLFTDAKKPNQQAEWHTLFGQPLFPVKPGSIKDCRNYIEQYKDVHGFNVYGMTQYEYQYISETYPGERILEPDLIRKYFLDIETETENGFPNVETANEAITLISFYDSLHQRVMVFSWKEFSVDDPRVVKNIAVDEYHMFKMFLDHWANNFPDVITGWNSGEFDITYLVHRINRVMGQDAANRLSPWGLMKQRKVTIKGQEKTIYDIAGIAGLDYLDLYKKSTAIPTRESYKLDFIGEVELDKRKVENPYASFKEFYQKDWNLFVKYNVQDVMLVVELDEKLKLLDLTFTVAYDAKVNFEDVQGQIRVWDVIIYNYLKEQNIVIPNKDYKGKSEQFEGAYVKEPLIGKHKNVASFDLDSLYPHLIMWANISPETLRTDLRYDVTVERLLDKSVDLSQLVAKNYAMTANGVCYTKDQQGFLPFLMEKMYADRKKFKKMMLAVEAEYEKSKDPKLKKEIARLNNLQLARKIQLNSAYGAIGSPYFRYYDLRIAEGITMSGQLAIRFMANSMNKYMNKVLKSNRDYIIAIDTDAFYLRMEDLVAASMKKDRTVLDEINFMDQVCEKAVQPLIGKTYDELAAYMNSYKQSMSMKREVLADVGIFVRKKGYALSVWDSEGVRYKEPKLKVKGLELVRSSTPKIVRESLKKAVKLILYTDEKSLQKYVGDFRKQFNASTVDEIAFPRGVKGMTEYAGSPVYKPKTPIHVRASLLSNHHAKRLGIEHKYEAIRDGDKIKFVYLRMPNPFREDVIAFNKEIPAEFKLDKYVDYDEMFEKTFLNAVNTVATPLGWKAEESASLEDFFG